MPNQSPSLIREAEPEQQQPLQLQGIGPRAIDWGLAIHNSRVFDRGRKETMLALRYFLEQSLRWHREMKNWTGQR